MGQWKAGIFGCFEDSRLCCLACFAPCYVMGKNAEAVGEDCMLIGLLSCLGLNFGPITRWRLRQEREIEGTMLKDVLHYMVLPCCSLIQEAKEVGWNPPKEPRAPKEPRPPKEKGAGKKKGKGKKSAEPDVEGGEDGPAQEFSEIGGTGASEPESEQAEPPEEDINRA